jgi:predicted nucleic acid-binding protein
VTVVDTSVVVDYLVGDAAAPDLASVLSREGVLAAPDLLVFEVLAVFRRQALAGLVDPERAGAAIEDLADVPIDLYPSLPLTLRAWELRNNLTAADALFVALAERLDEPFMTKDRALAAAARTHTPVHVIEVVNEDPT